jgi:hypothetical protein
MLSKPRSERVLVEKSRHIMAPPVGVNMAIVALWYGGLASSGAIWRWWYRAGERQYHVIDPRTGRPAQLWIDTTDQLANGVPLITSVIALAPTAAHAGVAAKLALLRRFPEAFMIVDTARRAPCGHATDAVDNACDACDAGDAGDAYGDATMALLMPLGTGEVACSASLQDYRARLGGSGDVWMD